MTDIKPIRTSLRQILVSLLLVYLSALLLATDGCTRAARAAIPADFGAMAVHSAAAAGLPAHYLESFNAWQAMARRETHAIFQAAWLGGVFRCAK